MQDFIQNILSDLRVDLTEAFDRNFERKAFFSGAPWKATARTVARGSLLVRTSAMRNSIQSKVQGTRIEFSSSKPYTEIHNQGGVINRTSSKGKSYQINIPQRQFIGDDPEVERIIKENVDDKLPGTINDFLTQMFNNNG
jgi:phage gpG-like protein